MFSSIKIIVLLLSFVVLSNNSISKDTENIAITKKSFQKLSAFGNSSIASYFEAGEDLEDDEEGSLNSFIERNKTVFCYTIGDSSGLTTLCKKRHLKRYLLLLKT